MSDEARRRAQARQNWPIRRYRLGAEPPDNISGETTVEQRLRLLAELSTRAWALTGRPIPDYDRSAIPLRLCHRL